MEWKESEEGKKVKLENKLEINLESKQERKIENSGCTAGFMQFRCIATLGQSLLY